MTDLRDSSHAPTEAEASPAIAEETTPLLAGVQPTVETACNRTVDDEDVEHEDVEQLSKSRDKRSVFGIISVLLIGVFVSSADITLVMATFANIASDFNALESGSWLLSSYGLASCVTQPLVSASSPPYRQTEHVTDSEPSMVS